jgi:hypothetical protein
MAFAGCTTPRQSASRLWQPADPVLMGGRFTHGGCTAQQLAARRHRVRLVVEDLDAGELVVLAESVSWRSIEVLGSAALYYAAHYTNPQRPVDQVRHRRGQANLLGATIWDVAEAKVGIEAP